MIDVKTERYARILWERIIARSWGPNPGDPRRAVTLAELEDAHTDPALFAEALDLLHARGWVGKDIVAPAALVMLPSDAEVRTAQAENRRRDLAGLPGLFHITHEAHALCGVPGCSVGIHRYPNGWEHVGPGRFMHRPIPRAGTAACSCRWDAGLAKMGVYR